MNLQCNGPCGQIKPEAEFPWRNRVDGVRHRLCSDCANGASRATYQQSPQTYSARVLGRRAETRILLESYTGTRCCQDCGECDPDVLVFDTGNGAKTANTLAASGRTFSSLEPDIASLTVRCLNCQRKAERRRERSEQGGSAWQPAAATPSPVKAGRTPRRRRSAKSPT